MECYLGDDARKYINLRTGGLNYTAESKDAMLETNILNLSFFQKQI